MYANWVTEQQVIDDDFSNEIDFVDEAYFSLCIYIYEQNYRIWGSKNSQVTVCVLYGKVVLFALFFKNYQGKDIQF